MINPFKNLIKRARTLGNGSSMPFYIANTGKIIDADDVTLEMALNNSDVFAIVFRISSDIAACNWITTSYYQKILSQPFGAVISAHNMWQSVVAQMILSGNAYCWLHRGSNGVITSIEPIPYDQVTPQLNDTGDGMVYTAHFDDTKRSGDKTIADSDMLHFRLLVDGQGGSIQYMGLTPLQALKREIDIQDNSNRLSLATLAHAITPTNIIKVPQAQLNKKAKDNIRESFESQYTGDKAGSTVVLDQSADLQQISITPDIAKFIANTNFSQEQIAKAFCVPADYLSGKQDAQSNINQIRSFYNSSLSLYIRSIESELSNKLNADVQLDVSGAIDQDHQQLIDNMDKLVKDKILTAQEAQKVMISRHVFPELTNDDMIQAVNDLNAQAAAPSPANSPQEGGDDNNSNDDQTTA